MPPRCTVLNLPGLDGSGEQHWQTAWDAAGVCTARVQQSSWAAPQRAAWVAALDAAVAGAEAPVVLVAHSLGCALVAFWAAVRPCARLVSTPKLSPRRLTRKRACAQEHGGEPHAGRVRGALLVAPADTERDTAPAAVASFTPLPRAPLPFPALLAASANDPYCAPHRAAEFAAAWRAELHDVGALGHINAASGLGDWPQGQALLQQLLSRALAD